jgi:putative ABC transport system substrate-binding protein
MTLDVTGKRLELLKQAVPKLSRVVVLWNPTNPIGDVQVKDAQSAAGRLGLKVYPAAVRDVADLSKLFARIGNQEPTGILVTDDNFFWNELHRIAALAIEHSLPAIAGTRLFPASQGLLSYGASPKEQYQRAAAYVDRILKGAKPAELPVERATKVELVVNANTAKALEVSIPQSILLRADEVIP